VSSSLRLDELCGNPHSVAAFTNTAFEDVPHAELATYLLNVDRAALVSEARITGDYEKPFYPRKTGDDVFDYAVAKVFLLRIATYILER
jgi:hypothetical protein